MILTIVTERNSWEGVEYFLATRTQGIIWCEYVHEKIENGEDWGYSKKSPGIMKTEDKVCHCVCIFEVCREARYRKVCAMDKKTDTVEIPYELNYFNNKMLRPSCHSSSMLCNSCNRDTRKNNLIRVVKTPKYIWVVTKKCLVPLTLNFNMPRPFTFEVDPTTLIEMGRYDLNNTDENAN